MNIPEALWSGQICSVDTADYREEMGQITECAGFVAGFRLAVQRIASSV